MLDTSRFISITQYLDYIHLYPCSAISLWNILNLSMFLESKIALPLFSNNRWSLKHSNTFMQKRNFTILQAALQRFKPLCPFSSHLSVTSPKWSESPKARIKGDLFLP